MIRVLNFFVGPWIVIFGVGHTSPAKLFRPDFSAKKKNVVQPTKIVCTLKISWNKIFVWLPIAFHFGSESWEEQLKNTLNDYIFGSTFATDE